MTLKYRSKEEEYMDNPDLSQSDLEVALKDISRVNALLGGNRITIQAIHKQLLNCDEKKEFTILDVGCGDGTMLRKIADFYKRKEIKVKLIGIDINEKSIQKAKELSVSYPLIDYRVVNVYHLQVDTFSCDLIISTLTLHHFDDKEITNVLRKCLELAKIGVIINDLHRSYMAYYLFKLFSLFFIKGYVAKSDGLVSIQRGFRKKELQRYAEEIPSKRYAISWKWAFRYLFFIKTEQVG